MLHSLQTLGVQEDKWARLKAFESQIKADAYARSKKKSINKGKRAEMILSVFSNHSGIKLEIRNMELPWWSSG